MRTEPIDADQAVVDQAKQAFGEHLVEKATAARFKYGLYIDTDAVLQMLDDRVGCICGPEMAFSIKSTFPICFCK